MKKLFKYALLFMTVAMGSVCFTACGDDDAEGGDNGSDTGTTDAVKPAQVFAHGVQSTGYDYSACTTDAEGRVTSLTINEYRKVVFVYDGSTRATSSDKVIVRTYYTRDGAEELNDEFTVTLNTQGFAKSVAYSWDDGDDDKGTSTTSFSYDSNGHLTSLSQTETDQEEHDGKWETETRTLQASLTYTNGDLTQVTYTEKESDGDAATGTSTFEYTSTSKPSGYDNSYNVMIIEMYLEKGDDILSYLYDAGLLGKSTARLPLTCKYVEVETWVEDEDDDDEVAEGGGVTRANTQSETNTVDYQYEWTLSSGNKPTGLATSITRNGVYIEKYIRTW